MPMSITYDAVHNLFDGRKRTRIVTLTMTSTMAATDSLSANSCGLNTIDAVVGGIFSGTVGNTTETALVVKATGTGGTTALLQYYIGATTNTAPLALVTNLTSNTVTGHLVVIGH
jgi:hypothetical protein